MVVLSTPSTWSCSAARTPRFGRCTSRTIGTAVGPYLSPLGTIDCFCEIWGTQVWWTAWHVPLAADQWLRSIKRIFRTLEIPAEYHVSFAAHRFTRATITWGETLGYSYDTQGMNWEMFENFFRESYFNPHRRWSIADKFESRYQGNMTVTEYYNWFMKLAQYCMARNVDAPTLISKFMSRLRSPIADKITEHQFNILMDCYASMQLVEANIKSKNVERS